MTNADPFSVLGLDARFDLDGADIESAFLRKAASLHPDHASTSDGGEIAALNEAKEILDDPERRADALLVLLGGPSRTDFRELPAGFLMEMMEIREEVEEARAGGESADLDRWEAWGNARRQDHIRRVGELLHGAPSVDAEALKAARMELNAWRYIERMIEQLDPEYDPLRVERSGDAQGG